MTSHGGMSTLRASPSTTRTPGRPFAAWTPQSTLLSSHSTPSALSPLAEHAEQHRQHPEARAEIDGERARRHQRRDRAVARVHHVLHARVLLEARVQPVVAAARAVDGGPNGSSGRVGAAHATAREDEPGDAAGDEPEAAPSTTPPTIQSTKKVRATRGRWRARSRCDAAPASAP